MEREDLVKLQEQILNKLHCCWDEFLWDNNDECLHGVYVVDEQYTFDIDIYEDSIYHIRLSLSETDPTENSELHDPDDIPTAADRKVIKRYTTWILDLGLRQLIYQKVMKKYFSEDTVTKIKETLFSAQSLSRNLQEQKD